MSISINGIIKLFIPNIDWSIDKDYSNLSLEDLLKKKLKKKLKEIE